MPVHPDGIISSIVVGLVLGALGRLLVPGRNPLGTIATIGIGLLAAFGGGYIGYNADLSFGTTLIIQIALAAVLVGLVGGGMRRSSNRRR